MKASESTKGGLKGASRGLQRGLKGACRSRPSRGLQGGFKGAWRGLQGGFIAQVALLLPWLQAQRDFWCSCESHTVSHRQEWHCGVPFLFNRGSYRGMLEPFGCAIPKSVFFCGNTAYKTKCLALSRRGQKKDWFAGSLYLVVTISAAPQKQDVTEEKGLEKKRVIESEGSGLKEAGGLGTQPPGREWFGSKSL